MAYLFVTFCAVQRRLRAHVGGQVLELDLHTTGWHRPSRGDLYVEPLRHPVYGVGMLISRGKASSSTTYFW